MDVVTENVSEAGTRHSEIRELVSQASGLLANVDVRAFDALRGAVGLGRRFVGRNDGVKLGLSLDDHVSMLEIAIRSIGLTDHFARLVLSSGHGRLS